MGGNWAIVLVDQNPDTGEDGATLADDHIAPTLVLLPGLDGTGILFRQFAKALEASFDTQIVAYPADRPLGYAELEALVREAVPRDRPFVVLGESFSGPIAIRLGAGRPPAGQVVAQLPTAVPPPGMVGLILCVTFAKNPYPSLSWAGALARSLPLDALPSWVKGPFLWGPSSTERERLESELATAVVGHDVLRHRVASVLAVDETASLARVQMPTLVLHASDDRVVPRAASEHIMRTVPYAELVEIRGPHMLLQIRAAECAAAVVRFMQNACDIGRGQRVARI